MHSFVVRVDICIEVGELHSLTRSLCIWQILLTYISIMSFPKNAVLWSFPLTKSTLNGNGHCINGTLNDGCGIRGQANGSMLTSLVMVGNGIRIFIKISNVFIGGCQVNAGSLNRTILVRRRAGCRMITDCALAVCDSWWNVVRVSPRGMLSTYFVYTISSARVSMHSVVLMLVLRRLTWVSCPEGNNSTVGN